ncbi:hypothetical protein PSM7751_03228 [Pseudooceanicola marinus]|uniref:Uncharacterized protein n=1 Tax=Pseudooceanicola marinus TaxID=396013 RepID=A0A1X6ZVQ4_9RHOB|nr:hypothetical protein PSM7751_03228 [Pseudooceanicola marinus]
MMTQAYIPTAQRPISGAALAAGLLLLIRL